MNLADEIRRFLLRFRGIVNVREFGAWADGSTDDLGALQRAASDGRTATLIVDGPCYVSAAVLIPANLPVRFEGNGAFAGPGAVAYTPWAAGGGGGGGPAVAPSYDVGAWPAANAGNSGKIIIITQNATPSRIFVCCATSAGGYEWVPAGQSS
jgi:hypothetical protein